MKLYYNVQVEDLDTRDAPDFCDAYISYAEHEDGSPLTDAELDKLNEDSGLVHEYALKRIYGG
jgi:hypothetical protein